MTPSERGLWHGSRQYALMSACVFVLLGSCIGRAAAQPTVGFEIGGATATGSPITVKVVLSAASMDTVTVQYATQNGSAEAPGDYTAAADTLAAPVLSTSAARVE